MENINVVYDLSFIPTPAQEEKVKRKKIWISL